MVLKPFPDYSHYLTTPVIDIKVSAFSGVILQDSEDSNITECITMIDEDVTKHVVTMVITPHHWHG